MQVDNMRAAVALVLQHPVALGTRRPTELAYQANGMVRRRHIRDPRSLRSSSMTKSTRSPITSTMASLEANSGDARSGPT